MPGLIADYVDTLRRELSFDRDLAARACEEIEAHLHEAAAAAPTEAGEELAVGRMGKPKMLATGFAEALLPKRVKSVWRDVALAAVAIFLAMRLRNTLMPVVAENFFDPLNLAILLDRCAFFTALITGILGVSSLRVRATGNDMQRALAPLSISAGALAFSTAAGLFVICASLFAAGWSQLPIAPLLAAMSEIAVLVYVFAHLGKLRRQARAAVRV